MRVRKAFQPLSEKEISTKVYDSVSATIPDQSLSLRDLMMKFAYIGNERLEEIVNRGFDGDEDEDVLGVDVGALDFAEVHDRVAELRGSVVSARAIHAPQLEPEPSPSEPVEVKDAEPSA